MRYNTDYSPRYFGRPPAEPIPTQPRQLTEFRGRLGSLIEYGLGVTLDYMLKREFGPELRLSFVVNHRYPDYYFRRISGDILLRLDCKLLHDESAEKSARFEEPTRSIDSSSDMLVYAAWQWRRIMWAGRYELEYPHVLEALVVPALDMATERDIRLIKTGGTIDADGRPHTAGGGNDTNYGKVDRIIHSSRRAAGDLTPNIRRFLEFTQTHAAAMARAAQPEAEATPTPDELSAPE